MIDKCGVSWMRSQISLFKFLPLIVFVDDESTYLKRISALLHVEWGFNFRLFDKPEKAFNFIKESMEDDFLTPLCSLKPAESAVGLVQATQVDLSSFRSFFSNVSRHDQPALLIVDENMPLMRGSELCAKIREELDSSIKIIMLTGHEEADFGANILNKNHVDKFIKKEDFFLSGDAFAADIQELFLKYFRDRSRPIMENLAATPGSPLKNSAFIAFHQNFCHEKNIEEYYLLDAFGSMVCIDNHGKLSMLAVKSDGELSDLVCQLEDDDLTGGAAEILSDIKARKKIAFLLPWEQANFPVESWGPFMHVAHKIPDLECYYSHISDTADYDLDQPNVVRYRKYLSEDE